MLTFRDYMSIITEDAAADIAMLQGRVAQLQQRLAQTTAPIQKQIEMLQKQIAAKRQQADMESKREQAKTG